MNTDIRLVLSTVLAGCVWAASNVSATAQSGTRQPSYSPRPAPARSYAPARPQGGSGTRQTVTPPAGTGPGPSLPSTDGSLERPPLAFGGRCAVCLIDGKQWTIGNPRHSVIFDGFEYRFPTDSEKNAFLANPDRYVPALNGDSVVEFAASGARVPGDTRFGLFYNGRAYLFQNNRERQQFQANPAVYADADLAYRGASAVSFVETSNAHRGSPEFATRYRGFRYLFTSDQERQRFLSNPNRYAQRSERER